MIYKHFEPKYLEALREGIGRRHPGAKIVLNGMIQGTDLERYLGGQEQARIYKAVYVDIEQSEEQFTKCLSKSTRQNLRTAKNRMLKQNVNYSYRVFRGKLDGRTNCVNSKYAYFSPVFRACYDFILECIHDEKGRVERLDFTSGDEDYKYRLNGKECLLCCYTLAL